MKVGSLFFLCVTVLSSCATAPAQFVDRGFFNNTPFAMGTGKSADEARDAALKVIPPTFEVDRDWTAPVLSCGTPGESAVWDELKRQNSKCPSGRYRVDLALLPKEGPEREAIIHTRIQELDRLQQEAEAPAQN